jgi:hypothetical protein
MAPLTIRLPSTEFRIIRRYLDGVSHALSKRFGTLASPKSPGEENLTFLLGELLDDNATADHVLEYSLKQAKDDLAKADGGFSLDVSFQTHEHTRHIEHNFSGADLGLVFVVNHPLYGHSERAVLLQAKRLFPTPKDGFGLTSAFDSFHADQRDVLTLIEKRFEVQHSIFYLWYAPSSNAFSESDSKLIRALEATAESDWHDMRGYHPVLDHLLEFGWPWYPRPEGGASAATGDAEFQQAWRSLQPATRFSSLTVVTDITKRGAAPTLMSLYNANTASLRHARHWRAFAFEPFAELFFLGLLSRGIGNSSPAWLRLARGEQVPLPGTKLVDHKGVADLKLPDNVPAARHSLTFTLGSSLRWPDVPHTPDDDDPDT